MLIIDYSYYAIQAKVRSNSCRDKLTLNKNKYKLKNPNYHRSSK